MKKTAKKKTARNAETAGADAPEKKPAAILHRVMKVAENGRLKVPGATVLKGAEIPLTKADADRLNEFIPGCVIAIGI